MRRALAALVLLALLAPGAAHALTPEQVTKVLDRQMAKLGPFSAAYVEEVESGVPVYADRATTPLIPASVQKLWTAAAALAAYRDDDRLTTAVLKDRPIDIDGVVRGNLYLRGAGDPTLTTRDLRALARQVARSGILKVRGRIVGDGTVFDRRRGLAHSGFLPTPDVPPLAGLMVDRGQIAEGIIGYQRRPALFAARKLSRMLRERDVAVGQRAGAGRTPLLGLAIAGVTSPTVRHLVKVMNVASDNYIAETFLKLLGRGTTAGGTRAVRRTAARRFGSRPTVVDGSGISRGDASTARDIVALLVRKVGDPAFVRSLPVAGRTGTVAFRLRGPATYDRCRAKTGTLRDVSTLAGYCGTLGGQTLAFAILNNGVSPYAAHVMQDKMTSAIARYAP